MNADYSDIYKQFFVDKGDERLDLFKMLTERFKIESGLYPGSFVHITPSLVIPRMVYVDTDKRCKAFFSAEKTKTFIEKQKEYEKPANYRFHKADFSKGFEEQRDSFDLLISFYAGFISKYCGVYLREGGILVANNSHGDAPLAHLDESFQLIGVVKRSGNRFSYSDKELDSYFIPKGKRPLDREAIEKSMKGPGYTRDAYAYVFRKVARRKEETV